MANEATGELEIVQFPCLSDNYGVLLRAGESVAAIDAPEADAVMAALDERGWHLTHVFTTHHHPDHVQGNAALKARFGCEITGPVRERDRIPGIDRAVGGGDAFAWAGREVRVIDTPGHTAGEVSFYLPDDGVLFAGDTLFACGCGRLFEGTPADMWGSMQRLLELPDETVVYAGHEYTLSNARFAVTVDPDNERLRERLAEVERLRERNEATLPTTMELERATNPFLRVDDPAIRSALGMMEASDVDVFARVRALKDAA